eukprot:4925662-Pleurochrysis_carterae.AAC.3
MASSMCSATSRQTSQSAAAAPPAASSRHSYDRPHPLLLCARCLGGCETTYAPSKTAFCSGNACARLHKRPVSVRALRQLIRLRSTTSSRIAAMVASSSARLLSGQRRRRLIALTLNPSAVTASSTSTFAGAA